jgi:transposase
MSAFLLIMSARVIRVTGHFYYRSSREATPEFRKLYAKRAGVEGTVAQAVRTCEMRQARYIGSQKLRLQAFFTATAMNVLRAVEWSKGNRPASTPVSRFAKLVASAKLAVAA